MNPKWAPCWFAVCVATAIAQSPAPQPTPAQAPPQNVAETVTKEEPATFKARVNLVMVPVVVRDKKGRAIANLRQEDFQLFDRGKPQVISKFSLEHTIKGQAERKPAARPSDKSPDQEAPPDTPERFIGYLFDDIHMTFGDLSFARNAALKHIETSLQPSDRAAIFTTSGQNVVDFTDERDKLVQALMRIQPRPVWGRNPNDCPPMTYYMADLIQNKNDDLALRAAAQETQICGQIQEVRVAESTARAAASRMVSTGFQETHLSLGVLRDVIRRMSAAPGQRVLVLVSPGFVTPEHQQEKSELMDRAIKANVMISAIDARGLYTDPAMDIQQRFYDVAASSIRLQYERDAASRQADVLAEFAAGTGGTFFQNSNDLGEGFSRLAAAPEYLYLIGFSPQNLKLDGSFHALKVAVREEKGLVIQARRGYYAPKHLNDAEETAREELREAVFSREELHELSTEMRSQFFKPSDDTAKVTVLVRVALRNMKFRKVDDRNNNQLTVVSALFDRNGNFVTGNQKKVEMRLKDATIQQRLDAGFTLRSTFDVKPGTYLIRLVVRDAEGQMMAAQNGSVDIP